MENSMVEARPLIAKFDISKKDAEDNYISWIKKKHFNPKDFDIIGHLDKIEGVYVPFWLFEVSAESAWHGEVSHTESYTEWETKCGPGVYESKQVPTTKERTVWEPTSGHHYANYYIPVSASNVISSKEIGSLKLGQLDLKSYDESSLDGWRELAVDLNKMEAKDICNRRVQELENRACKYEVESLSGCSTKVTYNASNFVLLPMFVLAYTYKDKPYRNLMNGLTGEIQGDTPSIRNNIILTALAVLAALVVALMALSRLIS